MANIDIPNVTENIYQFQFVQEEEGKLDLYIIKKNTFGEYDIQQIEAKLDEKFSNNMLVNIRYVNEIASSGNNKKSVFIQKIKKCT